MCSAGKPFAYWLVPDIGEVFSDSILKLNFLLNDVLRKDFD